MVVLVVAALLGCASPAVEVGTASRVATALDAARRAEADLDYATARTLLEQVLARGDATPAELLQAHLLAGQIERTAGNDGLARQHFLVVLRAQPQWALPQDAPPKLAMFFELVRQEVVSELPPPAPSPSPPPVSPAPPIAAIAMTSVAGAAVAAGVVVGLVGEGQFADPSSSWETRGAGRTLALAGWSTTTVGVVLGVVGAALLVSAASAP